MRCIPGLAGGVGFAFACWTPVADAFAAELVFPTDWFQSDLFDRGQAEYTIYDARIVRYREPRDAVVTHVLVKEPWDAKRGVKWGGQGQADFEVIKLNQVLSIPTGIYRYEQMWTGIWKRESGNLLKFSLSHHETCGNTYKQGRIGANGVCRFVYHSYFDGEGDGERSFALAGSILYDELPLKLRLLAPQQRSGTYQVRLIPTIIHSRPGSTDARPAQVEEIRRGQGEIVYEVRHAGGADRLIYESQAPFKLLRWEQADGSLLTLRKSLMIDYWNRNRPGDEILLQ
jgi:hypothetical protein